MTTVLLPGAPGSYIFFIEVRYSMLSVPIREASGVGELLGWLSATHRWLVLPLGWRACLEWTIEPAWA